MTSLSPTLFAIDHDDYGARYVGRTADGRQFFLTTPFVPAMGHAGGEFIALYIFDAQGVLLEAQIDALGPRADLDLGIRAKRRDEWLADLGDIRFGRIEIAPFSVDRFDTVFGLVARAPEDDDDVWAVEAQPGNYMAFFEPWDSGEYDT
ncbi:hypothetical protein J2W22_002011 [Sphingomonas kyeonggiensis]|uniref:hypothetical protein n=1 Tax=Sphingomonas kyeonggiensis TaxID=1268553 RepID=UPI002783DF2E|nr:hypothetical protein [Sphingomonas kyeonggiensis]MDQ0249947.1 hypothetical protein [Sphingomonas kyeonggiensis]